jgi:hypothetical protein
MTGLLRNSCGWCGCARHDVKRQQFSLWLNPCTSSVMAGHLLHDDHAMYLKTLDKYPGQVAGSRPAMTGQAMAASK